MLTILSAFLMRCTMKKDWMELRKWWTCNGLDCVHYSLQIQVVRGRVVSMASWNATHQNTFYSASEVIQGNPHGHGKYLQMLNKVILHWCNLLSTATARSLVTEHTMEVTNKDVTSSQQDDDAHSLKDTSKVGRRFELPIKNLAQLGVNAINLVWKVVVLLSRF